jgi:hypothetical protein
MKNLVQSGDENMADSAPWTDDVETMRVIAESDNDRPVLMVNLNKYKQEAGYPDGKLYNEYMSALDMLLKELGGEKKFQYLVSGQPVGRQNIDEIIGIWYPSHKAFLSIKEQKSSARNFELRGMCIETAVLHRVSGA